LNFWTVITDNEQMPRLCPKINLATLFLLIFSTGPALAVDYGAELTVGDTEITFHILVIIGGILFLIAVVIGLISLYYRIGLPFITFLARVGIPILFMGAIGMCVFAFLGWVAGQLLWVTQIFSLLGGFVGLVWGARLFGQPGKETGPVRLSDFTK
jgi:hypothetical protein